MSCNYRVECHNCKENLLKKITTKKTKSDNSLTNELWEKYYNFSDLDLGIWNDTFLKDGVLHIRFSCECRKCGYTFDHNDEIDLKKESN